MRPTHVRLRPFSLFSLAFFSYGCVAVAPAPDEADLIRDVERARLQALIDADSQTINALHASDFELINPDGEVYSRQQYLGEISQGTLDYTAWDAGEITVRVYGDAAVIRYQDARFEVRYEGEVVGSGRLRHTNLYERRDGRWQIVWSHASGSS